MHHKHSTMQASHENVPQQMSHAAYTLQQKNAVQKAITPTRRQRSRKSDQPGRDAEKGQSIRPKQIFDLINNHYGKPELGLAFTLVGQ